MCIPVTRPRSSQDGAADAISLDYVRAFARTPGWQELSRSFAYHSYRRDSAVLREYAAIAAENGLPVWVTEQNDTHKGMPDRFEWSHALRNALCLHDILVEGRASLSFHFSYAMSGSKGLVLYQPDKQEWARACDVLRQFHNHIPPA